KIAGPLTVVAIFASSQLLGASIVEVAGISKACHTVARLWEPTSGRAAVRYIDRRRPSDHPPSSRRDSSDPTALFEPHPPFSLVVITMPARLRLRQLFYGRRQWAYASILCRKAFRRASDRPFAYVLSPQCAPWRRLMAIRTLLPRPAAR